MEYTGTDIYIWTHSKYKNNILPEVPCLITTYLLSNPDKVSTYLRKDLNVNKLLSVIAEAYSANNSVKILDTIINYVEG